MCNCVPHSGTAVCRENHLCVGLCYVAPCIVSIQQAVVSLYAASVLCIDIHQCVPVIHGSVRAVRRQALHLENLHGLDVIHVSILTVACRPCIGAAFSLPGDALHAGRPTFLHVSFFAVAFSRALCWMASLPLHFHVY
jgi:hypothetical protein